MLYLLSTSCVLTLASSLLFPLGYATAAQFLPTRGSSLSATRTTRTSRRSSPSRRPCGALLPRVLRICILRFRCIRHFVINIINNIRIHFIITFYVICAMIYWSFCCIYVWLDPGTYMIARFMSFYKPGVTQRCPNRKKRSGQHGAYLDETLELGVAMCRELLFTRRDDVLLYE